MATIGGRTPSREAALAMIAQVERQAGAIARHYAADDGILDRFSEFRAFLDRLSEFHLFIDMIENRLGAFEPESRAAQVRNLAIIRWSMLEMEIEVSSLFLDRMVTSGRPWPMGSQKFLRRRLTRLEDIVGFHAACGAEYELTPPNAGLMKNIRDRVDAQMDNSVPLADFGTAAPSEAPQTDGPTAGMPAPAVPEPPAVAPPVVAPPLPQERTFETPSAPDPQPVPRQPAPPSPPEVMIPGMMSFTPPVSKASIAKPASADAASSESSSTAAPMARPPAGVALPPDLLMAPPAAAAPSSPAPKDTPPPLADQLPPVPEEYGEDYVSQKAKAVAKLVEKPAAKPGAKPAPKPGAPAPPGLARRDFRLKVRDDADGYHYIEGNGLAVITESCRLANTTIDELARNLELSRPGLVLILNGRDPCSTELLKVLRRFVLRTGGLV